MIENDNILSVIERVVYIYPKLVESKRDRKIFLCNAQHGLSSIHENHNFYFLKIIHWKLIIN